MHDIATFILNVVVAITTVWTIKRFWGSFFEKKNSAASLKCVWIIFCVFQVISQYNNMDINVILTVGNAILLLLIAVCGYECKGIEKYFLLTVFCTIWALVEMFVFFLLSKTSLEAENLNAVGMVTSTLIMMALVYIIPIIWNKNNSGNISDSSYLCLLPVPIGSVFISITQFYFVANKTYLAISTSILLLFNIVIFEIYIQMNKRYLWEKERDVYVQQLNLISYNTLEQKKVMEDFQKEKHNLVNELIAIKGALESADKETIIRNIDKIIKNCNNKSVISDSGNAVVDAVINAKYAIAKDYGIEFQLKIFIPDELPIEQCDLGIVLGNAIDNAIEATKECENKDKVIQISMGVKKEAWILVIKNQYRHKIRRDKNGEILSTKMAECGHGYGIKSIKKIADIYQGEVFIENDNSIFSLTVVLNF